MSYASLKSAAPTTRAMSVVSTTSQGSTGTSGTGESTILSRTVQAAINHAIAQETPSLPPSPPPKSPINIITGPATALAASTGYHPLDDISKDFHAPDLALTPPIPTSPTPAATSPVAASPETKYRPASKLAQLAQAKVAQQSLSMSKARQMQIESSGLMMPKSRTEYVTPIVNGPTATTAITTTYQSLGSLAQPGRPKPSSRGLEISAAKTSESKQSKLAMRSKRLHKHAEPESESEPALAPLEMPMFTSEPTRSRAPPSAFASILTDEESLPPRRRDVDTGSKHRESILTREHRAIVEKPRRKTHKRADIPPPVSASSSQSFAFDIPSPDDVVFNARRGTSLAPRSMSTSTHPAPSTVSNASRVSSSTAPLPIRASFPQA
ncbi:uncharacterized protein PHACADRAFT_249929 [Phanerochaete carnosa HHB-10118-sp]|uniref:Uncharacterized protein n=1 Tax=Phanerochaete carnosa (strain HHB-10118-sp) TaxID=650164 RepID=K5W694_PHACS|nr:uncharacterized protein PHACADRAFT_249929 [Phanerochaete carnosa HHB-10118-sp]EKM59438.1 hypothetical protein PHACADRAFT_249929 [Phanerochaete carnosa HHB-10118-sp]